MFRLLFFFFFVMFRLCGQIEDSIIEDLNHPDFEELQGKIPKSALEAAKKLFQENKTKIRVVSYNMLFNLPHAEEKLDEEDRWPKRKERVLEWIEEVDPDIIGSQELQKDQLDWLSLSLSATYGYYGVGRDDGRDGGEIEAIFYRKSRFFLVDGKTIFLSETPDKPGPNLHGQKNAVTQCRFRDAVSGREFYVLNVHFSFGNLESRQYEAKLLADIIDDLEDDEEDVPIIVMGDLNTFSFFVDLDLPFYDGDLVMQMLTEESLVDARRVAKLGHLGPIVSTNYSQEDERAFSDDWTPGVILDHILVNESFIVLIHGIDPARVDGRYVSDHFPVVADVIFKP